MANDTLEWIANASRPQRGQRALMFTCIGCRQRVPESRGCDDDMPHHCDDCWATAHPDLVPPPAQGAVGA